MENKKYSKIIVPSRGIIQEDTGSRTFTNGNGSFTYAIPNDPEEFSFKAIKKLFLDVTCENFILVGGDVEIMKDGIKSKFLDTQGNTVPKGEVMRYSLIHDYGIPEKNLTVLHSVSNTEGNAKEILKFITENNITNLNTIGILTNFYHLPRTLKTFKESANLSFIPMSAESVIYDEEFDAIRNFYETEGFAKILNSIKEADSEIKGMGDQEKGTYVSRFK